MARDHINEYRFFKLLHARDAEELFKNIKIGIDLIEHYAKKTSSPVS